jgi:hypothetical protein
MCDVRPSGFAIPNNLSWSLAYFHSIFNGVIFSKSNKISADERMK